MDDRRADTTGALEQIDPEEHTALDRRFPVKVRSTFVRLIRKPGAEAA